MRKFKYTKIENIGLELKAKEADRKKIKSSLIGEAWELKGRFSDIVAKEVDGSWYLMAWRRLKPSDDLFEAMGADEVANNVKLLAVSEIDLMKHFSVISLKEVECRFWISGKEEDQELASRVGDRIKSVDRLNSEGIRSLSRFLKFTAYDKQPHHWVVFGDLAEFSEEEIELSIQKEIKANQSMGGLSKDDAAAITTSENRTRLDLGF